MIKELVFNKVTDRLPDHYNNVIVFTRNQPMSDVGYYNTSESQWYLSDNAGYITAKDCGEIVEYWAEYPTNF